VVAAQVLLKVVVFVEHKGLIAVLENGQVLELNQELRDLVLIDEETCEQHEWNDKYWSKSDCELFVTEDGSEDKGVTS